jgi:hypothetical protein
MKTILLSSVVASCVFCASVSKAALALTGTSYSQTFDGIGGGLPEGWTVRTGATLSDLGSEQAVNAGTWDATAGSFKNLASADLGSGSSTTAQNAATDRSLGIRQTGSFGDPGAAFVLEISNTEGLQDFNLTVELEMLSVQNRSTTWTIDYRIGDIGDFTELATYADPATFGSSLFNFDSTDLGSWDDQSSAIWFRVVALSAATGDSGNRDTFGIDDFTLTFSQITPIPEPAEWALVCAFGLLGICGVRAWREARIAKSVA